MIKQTILYFITINHENYKINNIKYLKNLKKNI